MTREDFESFKQSFAENIIGYEYFLKQGYLLDLEYKTTFANELSEEFKYTRENDLLIKAIKALNENKGVDEIEELVKNEKAEYAKRVAIFSRTTLNGKSVIRNTKALTEDDKNTIEKAFEEFAFANHPAIKVFIMKKEADLFDMIKRFYYENNLDGFKTILDLNKHEFLNHPITDDKLNSVANLYYKMLADISLDVREKKDKYPYSTHKIFEDEMLILSERADINVRVSNLKKQNAALHKDLITVYGEDIKL